MGTPRTAVPLGPGDLDALTVDVGPAPGNLGMVLELPGVPADGAPAVASVLAERVRSVPALSRAIERRGRHLFWIDRAPQADRHVRILDARGGDARGQVGRLLTTALDLSVPPWGITVLVDDHGISVVFVANHVLTDGLHGLAMLQSLADAPGQPHGSTAEPPARSRPARPVPATDSPVRRLRLARLAPRTSLNRPTGPDRVVTTYDVSLEELRAAAHRAGATINDLLLVAISEAMRVELVRRGERPRDLLVWVPVAAPAAPERESVDQAGNAVGVMLVPIDLNCAARDRLAQVAAYTRRRKLRARQPRSLRAAHLISQASGRLGLARYMNQHQRIGNTSLSTMRGPSAMLHLAGHPIAHIVPAAARAANVGVSFIALSYAGTMTVSIVSDPAQLPDPTLLRADLAAAVAGLVSMGAAL